MQHLRRMALLALIFCPIAIRHRQLTWSAHLFIIINTAFKTDGATHFEFFRQSIRRRQLPWRAYLLSLRQPLRRMELLTLNFFWLHHGKLTQNAPLRRRSYPPHLDAIRHRSLLLVRC